MTATRNIAIRNTSGSRWRARHRVLACCLTLAALALVIPGSRGLAQVVPLHSCQRDYDICFKQCITLDGCRQKCGVIYEKCLYKYSFPFKTVPGKISARNYRVSGPVRVISGGPSNPVSGGNANPVSGVGNFSRSSAAKVGLKTSTKYKSQSNQTRPR